MDFLTWLLIIIACVLAWAAVCALYDRTDRALHDRRQRRDPRVRHVHADLLLDPYGTYLWRCECGTSGYVRTVTEAIEAHNEHADQWGIAGGMTPDERKRLRRNTSRPSQRKAQP